MPRLAADVHLDAGSLRWKANGEFREFDPSRVTGKDALKGTITGTVDASFGIQDLSAPMTPDAISADGRVTLTDSELAGVKINAADVDGQYAERRGTLRQATVKGPDIEVEASGPIALDTTGSTNLKYHVVATDIAPIGNRFDQQVSGSATVDGTITGNATSLQTTGTVNGSNLGYQSNNALDTNSTFTVTLPDLDANRVRVQARTNATFLQLGGLHINELRAETTYAEQKLDFQAHAAKGPESAAEGAVSPQGSDVRELDAGGTVIFHPDHQEIHLPRFAVRTQGVEWTMAPGGDAAVQYSKDRVDLQKVRLVNGNQSLDVSGSLSVGDSVKAPSAITVRAASVDLAQIDKLLLQGRGFTGTLNAEARITGDLKSPALDGHAEVLSGGFQQLYVSVADSHGELRAGRGRRQPQRTDRAGREADAESGRRAARERHGSHDRAAPQPSRRDGPHRRAARRRAGRPCSVVVDQSGHRAGLHEPADQRDRHAAGGRARHRIGRGSAPDGQRGHPRRRVHASLPRRPRSRA